MTINSIIIDDEPLARKGLREYISDIPFLRLLGEYDNPVKAMEILGKGEVQLLFLDIQMPKVTGIDFFRSLQPAPPVIFTTAFPQYALEGFEVNALDYLVKPISFERFMKAALKAKEFFEVREQNGKDRSPGQDYFFIKADGKLVKIPFDTILFVEATQNYVTIVTTEKKHITYLTFKSVEDYLPDDQFIKVHKSYIVPMAKVNSIDGNEIRIGNHSIPISRTLKEEVLNKLLKDKFLKR